MRYLWAFFIMAFATSLATPIGTQVGGDGPPGDRIVNTIEPFKLVAFRAKQMTASLDNVAAKMVAQGYPEVGKELEKTADAINDAKEKTATLISDMTLKQRQKIIVRIEGSLDIVDTALGIVDKIPFVMAPGTHEAKQVVAALQSLEDSFKGQEPIEGDLKALEELLSVTGVPEVVKVSRSVFKFVSKFLKLIGQGDSAINDYVNQSVQIMDVTLDVYSDAISQAGDVAEKSWKDTSQQVKDNFLNLFKLK